jgi:hypothetical protein
MTLTMIDGLTHIVQTLSSVTPMQKRVLLLTLLAFAVMC